MTDAPCSAPAFCDVAASAIVAAYVANHHVAPEDLPGLVLSVGRAVAGLAAPAAAPTASPVSPEDIRRSIRPDGLVSFLDGRRYQALRRHLGTHGLTPDAYRARFGLPRDYPMVCANFSKRRSVLSRAIGIAHAERRAGVAVESNVVPMRSLPPSAHATVAQHSMA